MLGDELGELSECTVIVSVMLTPGVRLSVSARHNLHAKGWEASLSRASISAVLRFKHS